MNISKRERHLLLLLALVAAGIGLQRLWGLASNTTAPALGPPGAPGRRPRATPSALPSEVVVLRDDLLEPKPRPFEVGRDLFRFGPPPPPPGPTPEQLEQLRRAAEEQRRASAEAARLAAVPRPPEVNLRYLGSFGPDGAKIAVFVAPGGREVLNARVGDVLEGKFIVARIGFESVDLEFVGFPDAPARRLGVGG